VSAFTAPLKFLGYSYPNTDSCMPLFLKTGMGQSIRRTSDEITQQKIPEKD
jgi:hypothetical protein